MWILRCGRGLGLWGMNDGFAARGGDEKRQE